MNLKLINIDLEMLCQQTESFPSYHQSQLQLNELLL